MLQIVSKSVFHASMYEAEAFIFYVFLFLCDASLYVIVSKSSS